MTTTAKTMTNEFATKLQIGTAACAIAIAAAVPATVANAEPAMPAPIAPMTQVLGSGPILGPADFTLSPIEFAEQPFGWWLTPGSDGETPVLNYFGALALAALGLVAVPVVAFFEAAETFIKVLFRVGPYGTGE